MEYEREKRVKCATVTEWNGAGGDNGDDPEPPERHGEDAAIRTATGIHTWLIRPLIQAERWARRKEHRTQVIRTFRNIVYFGIRRPRFLSRRRLAGVNPTPVPESSVLTFNADFNAIIPALDEKGFHAGCQLDPEIVAQLRQLVPLFSDGVHVDVHRQHAVVQRIVDDPGVLRVVSDFLRCEPTLLECKLSVGTVYDGDTLSAGFHFDHAGAPSLNFMVYLTDIDEHTAPHVVIERSQAGKRIRDFFREVLPMSEANIRFQDRIRTITGPAGTVIFENTEMFHTRIAGHKRRAILNVLYSVRSKRLFSVVTAQSRLEQALSERESKALLPHT